MKYFIANWKSNLTLTEAQHWIEELVSPESNSQQIIIAPPFTLVAELSKHLTNLHQVALAVQDLSPYPAGSYTGAISVRNIEGLTVTYVIVGHSERRRYFHETHAEVAMKVTQALEHDLTPILCIDDEYLLAQAVALDPEMLSKCIVAYEPLEAIGSGLNQPIDDVVKVVQQIREVCQPVAVVYGGSVDAENVAQYLAVTDGVLVGGASLAVEEFSKLLS